MDKDQPQIPGRTRYKIPVVGTSHKGPQNAVITWTPEWRISFDKHAKGNIGVSSGTLYVECYGWTTETSRFSSGDLNGKLLVSGSSCNSDLVVMLPFGPHGPKLEGYMYDGTLIDEIKITRFAWKQGTSSSVMNYLFEDCRIDKFVHCMRYYVLYIHVQSKTVHSFVHEQDTGKYKGNKMTYVHFGTGVVKQQKLNQSKEK